MTLRAALTLSLSLLAWSMPAGAQPGDAAPSSESATAPQGEIRGPFEFRSQLYPGTVRDYWLYIPQQYDAANPACVFVVQDGLRTAQGWNLPAVLDDLIHSGEAPVQIGVFVNPGVVPPAVEGGSSRPNRSFEYDALGDLYSRFLLEELLPEVARSYNLSDDPNDRAIAGASSGAIAAFNAAWERPDAFRRVFSAIGTYTALRGGDAFPTRVRMFEPRPIRVFLQDGSNDQNNEFGNWWLGNQSMLSALEFSGYDANHAWDEGAHNGRNAAPIMTDAVRWLWRDYPQPVQRGTPPAHRFDIVIPGEEWEQVADGFRFTEGPVANAAGELYFTDMHNHRIHKLDADGNVSLFAENTGRANGLMFGPDGKLYACAGGTNELVRYDVDTREREVLLTEHYSNDICVLPDGSFYYTDPHSHRVWHVDTALNARIVDEGILEPNGLIINADRSLLWVSDTDSRFVYQFQIQPDGSLAHKQAYGRLYVDDTHTVSDADGMAIDTQDRLYVTTDVGIQVLDTSGRVRIILEKPQDAWLSNLAFGGPDRNILYATSSDKLYRRRLNATGIDPWRTN